MPRFIGTPPRPGQRVRVLTTAAVPEAYHGLEGTVLSMDGVGIVRVHLDQQAGPYAEPTEGWGFVWRNQLESVEAPDSEPTPDPTPVTFTAGTQVIYRSSRGALSDWDGHLCTVVGPDPRNQANTVVTSNTGRMGIGGNRELRFATRNLHLAAAAVNSAAELRVGQRVRIVGPNTGDFRAAGSPEWAIGEMGTITEIVPANVPASIRVQTTNDNYSGWWYPRANVIPVETDDLLHIGDTVQIIGPVHRMAGLGREYIDWIVTIVAMEGIYGSLTQKIYFRQRDSLTNRYVYFDAVRKVSGSASGRLTGAVPASFEAHECLPTVISGLMIAKYSCGCEQICPEHSPAFHAKQSIRIRKCWTERGSSQPHGWSATYLRQRPPAPDAPTCDQAVCNGCDLQGLVTSHNCGECQEYCATCHRAEYVAQCKWLINCWAAGGGDHGWPFDSRRPRSCIAVENETDEVREACVCENRSYGGGPGIRRMNCGCEWYCPECRRDDYDRMCSERGVTTSRWLGDGDGCWLQVRLRASVGDHRPSGHGWWPYIGERPKPPLPEILKREEEEVPKVSDSLLSATLTNKSGYVHRLITAGWPTAKAERLASFATSEGIRQKQYVAAQVLEYPRLMLSRELAISKHQMVLDVVGHKPIKFEARQPAIPDLSTVKFDKSMITGRFLDRAGVELEGGWDRMPAGHVFGDGSVQAHGKAATGEIHIINYASDIRWEQMEPEWPQRVDATCGMHVHLSFKTRGIYGMFVCKQFHDWLAQEMKRWGQAEGAIAGSGQGNEFYRRLSGQNTYCKDQYQPDSQLNVKGKNGVRYSRLNYCYALHHTLEVRVLPMFPKVAEARAVIEHLLLCFEKWAEANSADPTVSVETAGDDPKKLLAAEGKPELDKLRTKKALENKQRQMEASVGQLNRADVRAVRDGQRAAARGGRLSDRFNLLPTDAGGTVPRNRFEPDEPEEEQD